MLSHRQMTYLFRKSLRNGNWFRLNIIEKALFRCGLWVARARGCVRSPELILQLLRVASRLLENVCATIDRVGKRRAAQMLEEFSRPQGVFTWAPKLREWLQHASFVRYLGLLELNE
jgi:hypothetical protein